MSVISDRKYPKYEKKGKRICFYKGHEWISLDKIIRKRQKSSSILSGDMARQTVNHTNPLYIPQPPSNTDGFINSAHTILLYFITLICLGSTDNRANITLEVFFFLYVFFFFFCQALLGVGAWEKTSTLFLPGVFNHARLGLMDVWAAPQLVATDTRDISVQMAREGRMAPWCYT